ncbi:MAG: phosphotransferase [Oscillospiraceae bacterium]|nr:phosphotransferase [Oscillospiraceae bacterium]
MAVNKEIIEKEYNISVTAITPAIGGLSASAYKLECKEGIFWLKEYDKTKINSVKQLEKLSLSMNAAFWLENNTGLKGRINSPILTAQGEIKVDTPNYTYLLFLYINGVTPRTKPLTAAQQEELAEIVGELHRYGAGMPFNFSGIQETYEVPCDELLRIKHHEVSNSLCIYQKYDMLMQAIEKTSCMAARLKAENLPLVLCHADIHGWNLIQSDRLILIDWESIRYAPAEADLYTFWGDWYWGDSKWGSYWDTFLPVYQKIKPDYVVREDVLKFYQLRRHIEDIEEFYKEYIYDDISNEEADEIKAHLQKECDFLSSLV